MSRSEPVVEFQDVDFAYDGAPVLKAVDLEVAEREFLGVIGPNGSGKTTLLLLMLGLLRPGSGTVRVFGLEPRRSHRRVGYVPQNPNLDPDFPIAVEDVVLQGRLGQSRLVGGYRDEDVEAAHTAMRDVEVHHLRGKRFGNLSGGEQRRALIARGLATRPELLLLDEPTVGVDHRVEHEIFSLLDRLNEEMTIILVSHDVGCVTEHVNRIACVHQRLYTHSPEELTGEVLEAVFGGPARMAEHHPEE
ncbi:MAG: metal ABC transporter ATP-binding protein [Planctomycetota bacterium]